MSKKCILLLSFGTVNCETRKKCIYAIENNIEKMFTQYDVYTAFTSSIIVKKIKNTGEEILSAEEAINMLSGRGYKEIIIQPVLITDGEEYKGILNIAEKYENMFKIKVGKPLLNSGEDYDKISQILIKEAAGRLSIFMGHGNENHQTDSYIKMQDILFAKGCENIYIAAVEGKPSFDDAVSKIPDGKEVFLQPMMIAAGEHAKNDMAGDTGKSLKSRLLLKGCKVNPNIKGLGEIPDISDILAEHIKEAVNQRCIGNAD